MRDLIFYVINYCASTLMWKNSVSYQVVIKTLKRRQYGYQNKF